jgi:hypothetical protein
MIIIDLPVFPAPAKIDWKPRQPTQVNRSEFTGTTRAVILAQAPYWAASVSYPTIAGERAFRPWRSALMRLQGRANAFRISACEGPQHRAYQEVVVDGAGQQGYNIALRGFFPGVQLLDGMFVTIGEDLHQVVADTLIAAADGKLTVSIMPHLAGGIPDGLAVETMNPWALMQMTTDQQGWTVDVGQRYSVSFDCESVR